MGGNSTEPGRTDASKTDAVLLALNAGRDHTLSNVARQTHLPMSTAYRAMFHSADISSSADVQALIQATVAEYGRLDIAVNNAALKPDGAPLEDFDEAYWDRLHSVDLKGTAICVKYEIRQFLKQGDGGFLTQWRRWLGGRQGQARTGRCGVARVPPTLHPLGEEPLERRQVQAVQNLSINRRTRSSAIRCRRNLRSQA